MALLPAIPDYTALAGQQATAANNAANATTVQNRANQSTDQGNLTWTQDPTTGQWTQQVQATGQTAADNAARLSGAGGFLNAMTPITAADTTVTMPTFGASQDVINATKALAQPGLDLAAEQQRQRMAAMGITLGSDASNASENQLATNQRNSDYAAILAGTTNYNTLYQEQLAAQEAQYAERVGGNASNLASANGLQSGVVTPQFASYASATPLQAPNLYGAGVDTFNAGQAQYNAQQAAAAQSAAGTSSLINDGINALKIPGVTSAIGSGIGSLFGSGTTASTGIGGDGSASLFGSGGIGSGSGDLFGSGAGDALSNFWSAQASQAAESAAGDAIGDGIGSLIGDFF